MSIIVYFIIIESMLEKILETVLIALLLFFGCLIIKIVFYDFLDKHFVINFFCIVVCPILIILFEIFNLFL